MPKALEVISIGGNTRAWIVRSGVTGIIVLIGIRHVINTGAALPKETVLFGSLFDFFEN